MIKDQYEIKGYGVTAKVTWYDNDDIMIEARVKSTVEREAVVALVDDVFGLTSDHQPDYSDGVVTFWF